MTKKNANVKRILAYKGQSKTNKAEFPAYMRHVDTGETRLFRNADTVEDGFIHAAEYDAAATAAKPEKAKKDKSAADKDSDAPAPEKGLAKKNGWSKKELVDALTEAGVEFPEKATADELAALYIKLEDEPEDETDGDGDDGDAGDDDDDKGGEA